MFSSFSNILSGSLRSEANSSQISLVQATNQQTKRRFFKRKCCDVDQNLIEKTDDEETSRKLKHRTLSEMSIDNKTKELDNENENKIVGDEKDVKSDKPKLSSKRLDKLSNKSKEKSSKVLNNKFSKWLYNKFERHCPALDSQDVQPLEAENDKLKADNSVINSKENLNSDESVNNLDRKMYRNNLTKYLATPDDYDDSAEESASKHRCTNELNLQKKLSNNRNRGKEKIGGKKNDETSSEESSTEEECEHCKQKIKKLKLERLKLKKQLRRRINWKKYFVFANPIFLLAVFFYLLYSELTAVRAESSINLTTTISNQNLLNKIETNSLNNLNATSNLQLISERKAKNLENDRSRNKLNKKLEKSRRIEQNRNVDQMDNENENEIENEIENENQTNENEQVDKTEKENLDFYSFTLTEPLKIPISKRNFFNFNSAKTRKSNQQFDDLLLLNPPAFKILAILPITLSPQLSRHLHRSMELYFAYSEGLVSSLELAQYFEHLRHPNGAQTDLSSSLHHLQMMNTTISDHHHNDKFKFLFYSNHSELNFEDHLYAHLIQRIHHRNRTQHYSETNSLFSATPDKSIIHNDQFFANNPHLNEKQYIEHFIQSNRKRLRPTNHQAYPSSQSNEFAEYTHQPELQLSLLPLGNSSQRLINSLCDSIEIQRPTMILSLVEPTRNYYLELLAGISDIPMLTLTSEYQETASLQKLLMEGKFSETSMQLSLDPPISALADATFSLLLKQHWFDAILLIDDTSASDLFSYRLSQLCRQNGRRNRVHQNKHSMYNQQTKYSTFASTNGASVDGIKNYNRKEWIENSYQYLDSIWSRLKVIQVSKNLLQKELYLELSEIQTNHRRVVLVHCDKIATKRVIETSKTLGLLDGSKIWILLDGVIGSQITNPSFLYDVNLPVGTLAIHQRAPSLQDPQTLFNIVRLIGETAANTLLNAKTWMNEGVFSNGTQPEVSCWQKSTSARIKYSQVVYRELKKIIDQFTYARQANANCKNEETATSDDKNNNNEDQFNLKSLYAQSVINGQALKLRKDQNFTADHLNKVMQSNRRRKRRILRKRNSYHNNYLTGQRTLDENKNDLVANLESLWPSPIFDILNLVPNTISKRPFNETLRYSSQYLSNFLPKIALKSGLLQVENKWKVIGNITNQNSTLNSITFITGSSGDRVIGPGSSSKHNFRIVTAISPPFVQYSTKLINGTCLTGVPCLQVNASDPEDLVAVFTDFNSKIRYYEGKTYVVKCCEGISVDLLNSISRDLHFSYEMYLVADGLFGLPRQNEKWDGITGDLISGAAHMAFSAFSITSNRIKVIDFSVPFFYSGVSCLAQQRTSNVPITAFLLPFSIQLWVAIFSSLVLTAIAAATYEWLSPFGLNPWGRQRTKNFSIGSAFWVIFSILFSHLYAFKAPKSWPSKVLINLWGCFSVIFLATYTANVAAQFAGLFNIHEINNFHDGILMEKKTGVSRSSASEGYIMKENMELWSHVQKNRVNNLEEGIQLLRENKIEVLIGDTAILDYFRANELGCTFNLLGDSIFDDAYAIGMQRDFPLKDAISDLIMEYNAYGFLDQLQRRWYGRAPCLENSLSNLRKPKPLSVRALAGVFIMLLIGMFIGAFILINEHFVFKYGLPKLRKKEKDCFWKSPNLMFFSQKLYRFINIVELVSPHHSAKEIMTNLRSGQITSLFQKSLKRKAKEDARRRKSKYQFFEMIQEVRKVVKEQKEGREDSFEVGDSLINYPLKQESIFSETDSIGNQTTLRTSSIKWKEELTNQTGDNQRDLKSSTVNDKPRQGSVHTQVNTKDAVIRSTCIRNEKSAVPASSIQTNKLKSDQATKYSADQQNKYDSKYNSKYDHKFDDNFGSSNSKLTIATSNVLSSRPSTAKSSKMNQTKYSDQLNVDHFYKSPSSNLSSDFYSDKNCLLRVASNTHITHIDQPHLHYGSDNYGCSSNEKVQHINLHSNISISLEDVALPNDSGLGVGLIKREDSSLVNKKMLKKTLSFDDLKTLKNQLTYCLNSTDTANNSLNVSNCNLMMIEDNSVRNSLRSLIINSVSPLRHYNCNKFETVRNSNLSKDEVIVLWRNSERELLNTLNDVLIQKKQIEEKCILLQRMLTNRK